LLDKEKPRKAGLFYAWGSGVDESHRCGSKAAPAAQTAERRPQGENFDSIKVRITNCESSLLRARQREANSPTLKHTGIDA